MNSKRCVGTSVAALVIVLASTSGIGTASSAVAHSGGTTGWAIQALPTPSIAPNGHLSAVSCRTAVSCTAVGYSHNGRGVDLSLAEYWDGTGWTIQPTTDPDGANSTLLTGVSCSLPTACTAVGDYVDASGRQVTLAERWNGRRWARQPMPSPAQASESFLTALSCSSPTVCVAVGYSRHGSQQTTAFAERWDGVSWQLQSTPDVNGAASVRLSAVSCASASACTAVGFSGDMFADPQAVTESWNGTRWSLQPSPEPAGATESVLSSVSCPATSECVAVGRWHDSRKGGGPLAEHWNGTAWVVQPTPGGPTDVYNAVSCTAGNACLVIGKSELADFVAARWDGAVWTSTAAPASGTLVDSNYVGLSCVTVAACVAVGASQTANYQFTYLTLASGWNGSSWTSQPSANPSGATANQLVAVSCATERSCVAVGYSWDARDAAEPLAEHWDGTRWRVDSTPKVPGSSLSAVACSAQDDCLAVGSYVDDTGALAALAEHWDGASWLVEPTVAPPGATAAGFSGVSCRMVRRGGDLAAANSGRAGSVCIAVGAYADASGASIMFAARRSGTTWQLQFTPAPPATTASSLSAVSCATPTDCTAVGAFQTGPPTFPGPAGPCDFSCTLAEHWNGSSWQLDLPPAPQTAISNSLPSVSCPAPKACVAAGQWSPQDRLGGHPGITLAESWTGTGWTVDTTPDPPGVGGPNGSNNSPFEAVSCADQLVCTAVGNFDSGAVDDGFLPLAERRDAGGWSVQPVPAPAGIRYSDLSGISCPNAHMCMAVGMDYRYNVANLSQGPHVSLAELYSQP